MTTVSLPTVEVFSSLSQPQQKQRIEQVLSDFLDYLDSAGREADDWEVHVFNYTLTCLNGGLIRVAFNEVQRLLVPPRERRHGAPMQQIPATRAMLRAHLEETRRRGG